MQLKNNIFIRFTAIVSAAVMISACSGGGAAPAGAMGGGKQGGGPRQQKAAAISVNLTSPERETLERKTDFAARIEASQTVKVFPETGGTVSKVYFNVGDKVNKGDLLFELDSADAETSLRKAELDYQKTMANLESEETGSGNATTIRNYEDKIRSAQIKYESARESLEADVEDDFSMSEFKRAFERYRKADKTYSELEESGNATSVELSAAWAEYVTSSAKYNDFIDGYGSYTKYKAQVTSLENAYIDYLNAIEDYEIYKSMTEGEKAATRDISREQAEISLKTAKDNLADHKVYAPVSGVISAKTVSEFDNASANSAAYTISQEGMPCVSFNLSEDGANAMDIGTPITVWYNGKEYPAEVTELSPEADSSGLYPAKAQILEDIGTNRSGSVVKVTAMTAQEKDTLTISLDNIYYDGNQPYVFLFDNGIARRVDVKVGMTTVDKVSIVEGLSDSDLIISNWHPRLKDGAEVVDSTAAPVSAPANKEG